MTHVKFNTKPLASSFSHLVDDLLNEFPVIFKNDFNETVRKGSVPVNVKETENGYEMEVIAPGFEKTDFTVSVDQGVLNVSGEKKEEKNAGEVKENGKTIRREYAFRSFKRSFTLDDKMDATRIGASYINGVLTLNLPRKEAVKPAVTQIEIK